MVRRPTPNQHVTRSHGLDRTADRPRRGLPFEEALRRWSLPEAYAAMEALRDPRFDVPIIILEAPPDPREEAYHRIRSEIERALFDRLAEAELLASATEERPDPMDPRFLVHPSVFDDPSLGFSTFAQVLTSGQVKLWNLEIFEPGKLPRNVTRVPEWLDQFVRYPATGAIHAEPRNEPSPLSPLESFWHDDGYAHVSIRGLDFTLNAVQAGIVRLLHQAALGRRPWMRTEELRQEVGFKYVKLSGVFRHKKDPSWRELIASDGNGAYRLNI